MPPTAPSSAGTRPVHCAEPSLTSRSTTIDEPEPTWDVFPLKVFRGCDSQVVDIGKKWDDSRLLRELKKAYGDLRGWRGWFWVKSIEYVLRTLAFSARADVFAQSYHCGPCASILSLHFVRTPAESLSRPTISSSRNASDPLG